MYLRRQPSPPWPWATGPTRPTRSEPSLGRSELPRDRYTHMSQIEQVNSLPCFRLARRPGGFVASRREHTTSAHIAVAGVTRKSRSRRAPAAVTAVTERCRCGCGRVSTTPNRCDRMNYSRDAANTTYLSAQDPLWVHLGQSGWCSLDSWSASSTVTFTRRAPFGVHPACHECVERRRKSPAAESPEALRRAAKSTRPPLT